MISRAPDFYVYDGYAFGQVGEPEYQEWHSSEWKKKEPRFLSKLIGGLLYTVQTFYNGSTSEGAPLNPFSIFYMAGTIHNVKYFPEWLQFKSEYDKLIARVADMEERHKNSIGRNPRSGEHPWCIVAARACCNSKSVYPCTYQKGTRGRKFLSSSTCLCESGRN